MGPTRRPHACTEDSQFSPDSMSSSSSASSAPKHSEKRRENWRVSVRKRRSAEAEAFQDLREELPVAPAVLKPLDRLATLRVALCYVRLQSVVERLRPQLQKGNENTEVPLGVTTDSLLPDDAFMIIMSTGGEIIYVSDNVTKSLHCEKHTILGNNLYDYVQEADHSDLNSLLSITHQLQIVPTGDQTYKTQRRSITVALCGGGSGPGQLVRISGKVFLASIARPGNEAFFLGVVDPLARLPHPSDHDFPFPHFRIITVYDWACSADMRTLLYCNPDVYLGYNAEDFPDDNSISPFELFHPEDSLVVQQDLRKLYSHGEHQFNPYRILARHGGWAWFITQASTMTVQARGSDGAMAAATYCVGRDFMISEVIQPDQVLGAIQLGPLRLKEPETEEIEADQSPLTPTDPFLLDEDVDIDELMRLVDEYDTEGSLDELLTSFVAGAGPLNGNFNFNSGYDPQLQLQPQLPKMVIDPHPELSALFVKSG